MVTVSRGVQSQCHQHRRQHHATQAYPSFYEWLGPAQGTVGRRTMAVGSYMIYHAVGETS